MSECLVFGLPLDITDDDPIHTMTPLSVLVVIKALDDSGEVCYYTSATEGLKSVECLGMARLAVLRLEHGLIADDIDD